LGAVPVASAQSVLEKARTDEVTFMADADPEMKKAFATARSTLADFLKRARAPDPGTAYYAVKVGVKDGEFTEYFWIGPFSHEGDRFSGVLDNSPRTVRNVRKGQTYHFPKAHIVDWTFFDEKERRMHGNFTMCALLTKEPPREAEAAKSKFGLRCE